MAPKEAEKKRATTDAPVNAFDRNSDGSTSGLRLIRQWTTKSPIRITAAASTPTMVVVPHPQLLPSTSPKVSSPTPAVHRTTPSASGRSDWWPGRWGSERQPMIRAARPDRDVDQEHQSPTDRHQQPAHHRSECGGQPAGRRPGPHGSGAAIRLVGGEDEGQRGRCQQRGPRRLDHPEGDQHADAGRGGTRRRGHGEDGHPEEETMIAPVAIGQPPEEDEE